MPYVIIARNRPGIFRLQHLPEFPRAGVPRRIARRLPATLFETYGKAACAIDRGRYFTARNPEHWYAREWAEFELIIVRVEERTA